MYTKYICMKQKYYSFYIRIFIRIEISFIRPTMGNFHCYSILSQFCQGALCLSDALKRHQVLQHNTDNSVGKALQHFSTPTCSDILERCYGGYVTITLTFIHCFSPLCQECSFIVPLCILANI